jgi:uncharacterized membrane protein YphA (DoxX/SURF4 family)
MASDSSLRTTFIPLLLRLTLAAIFLYHGVTKIATPRNDWGMAWATNLWLNKAKVPEAPMAELSKGLKRAEDEEAALKTQGAKLSQQSDDLRAAGEKLSAGPDKDDNEKKQRELAEDQKRNADKLADNARRQEEFHQARAKIQAAYAASTPMPDALEFPGMQFAVAWGELLCGLAMLVGVLTRLAAVGIIVIMVGAIYTVTGARGFVADAGAGYEYNLAIVAMCVVLIIKGAGPVSLDGWLAGRRHSAKKVQQQPVGV